MDALYRWNARLVAWVIETGVVPRRADIVRRGAQAGGLACMPGVRWGGRRVIGGHRGVRAQGYVF